MESVNLHLDDTPSVTLRQTKKRLTADLRKAIATPQLQLFYQIQINSEGKSIGAETLLRWNHPQHGIISPAEFIPLAEESNLILGIGEWVLREACAQIKCWQLDDYTKDLALAVNVSAKQFHQAGFVEQVKAIVADTGIDPKLLKLELTESMLVDNIEVIINTMNSLKEIGVQFSLDDFGTGYSSLQYLKRLPLDQLKIDQSFVRNIVDDRNDRAIVRTVIAMAHSMNLHVIAEGVENEAQRQVLIIKGCTDFQGYLFSQPIPIEQFDPLLKQMSQEKRVEIASLHVDTSEEIECRLRQRDHHLLSILDKMPAMIGYWDKNLRNRFGNQAYSSWFGISPSQMLGMHLYDVLGAKLSKLNAPYVEGALRGIPQEFERIIPSPDGQSSKHSLAEYIPDFVNGEVEGFFVQVSDVSAIKRSEAELKRSETKFRALFESNLDALILADENHLLDCNPATLKMFGCDSIATFFAQHPSELFAAECASSTDPILLAKQRFLIAMTEGDLNFETVCQQLNREHTFPVNVHCYALELDGKRVLQLVIRDISLRKRAEANLLKTQDDLLKATVAAEVANQAKSTFLSTMSHELRTPMNGILGMAQLLLMSELANEEQRDYARAILNSGNSLLALLNDILDLSKVESGKLELAPVVTDISQLLKECALLFSQEANTKNIELTFASNGMANRRYLADSNRLRQMLNNLISNAVKFTHQGQVHVLAKELQLEDGFAVLEFAVQDSGIGIAQEKQALLFHPFTQVDNSNTRQFGGAGLGLSIVHRLAELMGGEVGVVSELGKGSRFWFRIRAEVLPEGAPRRLLERLATVTQPLDEAKSKKQKAILVVDDNQTNLKMCQAFVSKLGFESPVATNGQQAFDLIADGGEFEAVLMDIHMPILDGIMATQKIRAWEKEHGAPHLIIIAVTAGAYQTDRESCIAAGMDAYLSKPFSINELNALLRSFLIVC
jgi:PAS domain S-box-containing protein